ncbi:MAG: molecular chaperone DnaJ [Propionibacteriaceae bacterium]|jgi:molecular chaperone DnaJ|nr:molecular chaperone DnaJ [Propionibacteriaceae bacterium]
MSTKDWLEKDYYATLGLKKGASQEQIKKAFRKLARENHPDRHPGQAEAERRFKEVSEAHDVLSDPDKRREYDEARDLFGSGFRYPGAGRGGPSGGPAGVSLDDLLGGPGGGLGDLLGGLFNQAGPAPRGRGPRRGQDFEGEAAVAFADAAQGATVAVPLSSEAACPSCHGTGAKAGTTPRVCPACQGSGALHRQSGAFAVSEPCPKCLGRGLLVDDPCPDCGGSGRARSTRTIQVKLPAGVTDGQRIRVKGKGGAGANGGAPGDLYVQVHVSPHPLFGRQGDNLTLTAPVTYAEAALGAEIELPSLFNGNFRLRLPAGTPNGRVFRVRGKGIVGRGGPTDLLVTIEVQVPTQLPPAAQEALAAYAAVSGESDPRVKLRQVSR